MKLIVSGKTLTEAEREAFSLGLEKKRRKIERLAGRSQNGGGALLRATGRRQGHASRVMVSLSLSLRGTVLFAERADADVMSAVDRATESLLESLRAHHAEVVREVACRRHQRNHKQLSEAHPYLEEKARVEDREGFEGRLRPLLGTFYSLAVHEVRQRQTSGELAPGELDPLEVVDEVVARAYESFRNGTIRLPVRTALIEYLHAVVEDEVRARSENPALNPARHLDEDISENDPRLDVSTLGEEMTDFFQPDEHFRLEDVLAGHDIPDPAESLSAREQMRLIHRALRRMPRLRRQAFLMHADGYEDMEIAMVQKRGEEDVRLDVRMVREEILKMLRE